MKFLTFLLLPLLFVAGCGTKKTETLTTPVDSVTVDSVLATQPAAALLAFGAVDGYSAKSELELPDSVNYFLSFSEGELSERFSGGITAPDFIINYVVAVVCQPTKLATTITLEKVVTGDSSIDVYLTITRGESGKTGVKPTQLFAIERREGYPVMQFYVNGKKDKALVLVENP